MNSLVFLSLALSASMATHSAATAPVAESSLGNSAQPGEQAANAEAPSEKKICRRSPSTGSRIATQKTCLTKAEWDRASIEARNSIDKLNRASREGGARVNPGQ